MAFSKEQLQKFASLIRIDISDEKLEQMKIDSVINWLDRLKTINTDGITPMFSPSEHTLPRRADVVTDGNISNAILANAPDKTGVSRGYFAVPKIMDE